MGSQQNQLVWYSKYIGTSKRKELKYFLQTKNFSCKTASQCYSNERSYWTNIPAEIILDLAKFNPVDLYHVTVWIMDSDRSDRF